MPEDKMIQRQFERADAQRTTLLESVREYAALTIPSTLPPPAGQQPNEPLPQAYQNMGADGVETLVSRLVTGVFPMGQPWFAFQVAAEVKANPLIRPEQLADFAAKLYVRELLAQSQMNATNFRPKMRQIVESVIVTGNGLGRVLDDYNLQAFRFDQFVWRRDSAYRILWLITCERMDPLELDPKVLEKAELTRDDAEQKSDYDRQLKLYTRCAWQRDTKKWLIEQELNGHVVRSSEETVSPYIPVGYKEVPGEDYSRGLVEQKIGDLRSLNGLWMALVEGMVAFAKTHPVVDPRKGWKPRDLTKPNGTVLTGPVGENGLPSGIGFVTTQKQGDFRMCLQGSDRLEGRLGKSMLLEASQQPDGERVTAFQVGRIARENEQAHGGIYWQVAAELQVPYLNRIIHMMEAKSAIVPLPAALKKGETVQLLTGAEAVSRQIDMEKLMAALQIVQTNPAWAKRLREDVLLQRLLQGMGVDVIGLLKSDQEIAAEQQREAEQALRYAAGEQAIASAGAVAEQVATQQPTQAAA